MGMVSCSTPSASSPTGLMVVVSTDLAASEYDEIRVEVSQQQPSGQWQSWLNESKHVPSEVTLPASVFIEAGHSADQEVDVHITAYLAGTPVVLREAELQAPTDRLAALYFVLAEACLGQVQVTGAEAEPESTCPTVGESCQPGTGTCGPSTIIASTLPTFVPGQSLDAGGEAGLFAGAEAGAMETGADAGQDATLVDAGTDGTVSADASEGGSPCTASSACTAVGNTCADGATVATCARDAYGCLSQTSSTCTGSTPFCNGAGVCGVCQDGALQCLFNGVQACVNGAWGSAVACPAATPICSAGICGQPLSCQTGGAGLTTCPAGTGSESCCSSPEVTPNGPYYRTYTNSGGGPTGEADPATVSGFRLDKYLVTVGRFRQFVAAWAAGYYPPSGAGKHTHLNGGSGLNATGGGYETGWDATDWNNTTDIDPTSAFDSAGSPTAWTPSPGSQENLPINLVTWYEAYAFCIWDGGFLPSEAESEYAEAGGSQLREYPWGTTDPGSGNQYAIYNVDYTGNPTDIAPVGTAALGAGLWGQLDLAGDLWEWTLDRYATYVSPCTDCVNLSAAADQVVRGGGYFEPASSLLPPARFSFNDRNFDIGFRCARTP
jgi:formylglycine-generating enzyme required for sulfatase activity